MEAFVQKSTEQPGNLRHYVQDFTTISAKAVAAGNLSDPERGRWFVRGLPTEYRRHAIEKTGAVADEPSTFVFIRLKKAVESRMMVSENAKQMTVLPEEDAQNVQLIQELRQQRNEIDRRREGRLLDPVGPVVHEGAAVQSPPASTDQEMEELVSQLRSLKLNKAELATVAQSMPFLNRIRMDPRKFTALLNQATAQSPGPGHEDWQNSARPPQDSRLLQDSRHPQGFRYPQDSTAFGRSQRDARGQQGTRGQGRWTCFRCGGSHRFTEFECQGLKDLIQRGYVHISARGRLVAGTRD